MANSDVKCCNANVIKDLLDFSMPRGASDVLIKDVSDVEIKDAIWGYQSAFVNERSIVDNTLFAQELVRGYSRNNISPRCALKIYLQKAFDYLDWEFVRIILHALGLPEKFIGWIWTFITGPSYSIVLNGSLVGYFKGAQGVRQGDPLSPYIFVLAMNVLSRLLNLAAAKGLNIPNNVSWSFKCLLKIRPAISHILAGLVSDLSVRRIWESMRIAVPKVPWQHLVWFSGRIPKQSVITWMTLLNRLLTRLEWRAGLGDPLPQRKVSLCYDSQAPGMVMSIVPGKRETTDCLGAVRGRWRMFYKILRKPFKFDYSKSLLTELT
ncbi:uncharacterized protein LOC120174909 [Hibiscus syriacus]|uniref:uncharacterized protein LOC120174909 n=1 Tax=Hibiscus syriacus TaxID=106335 RepID=UPI001922D450|nr:uncharacterized protein LOC120174909 [Hibiscus syriacus]